MGAPHAIVIGAGSTGAAIAHDLALRGLRVTVVERGGVASGATGHNQAQLHSGARYAVNDPESARECIEENLILRTIMPGGWNWNDGLFVASAMSISLTARSVSVCTGHPA
jgi:glycerol-3-phosphate dehydrogenase